MVGTQPIDKLDPVIMPDRVPERFLKEHVLITRGARFATVCAGAGAGANAAITRAGDRNRQHDRFRIIAAAMVQGGQKPVDICRCQPLPEAKGKGTRHVGGNDRV